MYKYMFIYSAFSAILTALPFYFENLWPITFISLTPLLYYLIKNKLSKLNAFLYGFTYGFIFYLLGVHWLWSLYPLTNFGFNKLSHSSITIVFIVCAVIFFFVIKSSILPVEPTII